MARKSRRTLKTLGLAAMAAGLFTSASAQEVLFSDTMDSGDNWLVNAATERDQATFGFDYSALGIPPSPNGGGTTLGLRLQANRPISAGSLSGVSVSPIDKSFDGNYELRFDMSLSFPGPAPAGGQGSTQLTGAGIMSAGNVAHYAGSGDGLWFAATAEGGSSVDYRAYFRGANQTTAALYPAGGQNHTAAYYQTNFLGGVSAPAAQTAAWPSQTGTTAAGSVGWAWHDIHIKKIGNTVTWDIDNVRVANIDLSVVTATFGGSNILFAQSDINGTQTTAELEPLLFGLIDNVRVIKIADSTTVSARIDPSAGIDTISEADTAVVGKIEVFRPEDQATTELTVNFTATGPATRGGDASTGDYFLRINSVNVAGDATSFKIPVGSTNVIVEVVANNDDVSELTESIFFSIAPGSYLANPPINANLNITDNEPAMVDISSVVFGQMFEGNTNDFVRYRLQRRGDLATGPFDVNIGYAGTATAGADFQAVSTVTINPNDTLVNFDVYALNDSAIEGPETMIASILTGTGYVVGTNHVQTAGASATIVDDDFGPETILFSENFNSQTLNESPAGWTILYGSIADTIDYQAFVEDYSSYVAKDNVAVLAPHSTGDTIGLRLTVNKGLDAINAAAGINLYPNGQTFSGNYALKFDMLLMAVGGASTTEYATFGINHSGTKTNWFRRNGSTVDFPVAGMQAGWEFDGIWAQIVADASVADSHPLGAYVLNTAPGVSSASTGNNYAPTPLVGRQASTLSQVFHNPPWSIAGLPGAPSSLPASEAPKNWAQVEMVYSNSIVTLRINNTNILSYTNATAFTSGNIMLGYDDGWDSTSTGGGGYVVYDNVRVVRLDSGVAAEIKLTTVTRTGGNLQIDFTAGTSDTIASFRVLSSDTVNSGYATDAAAVISEVSPGNFRIVIPFGSGNRFFQVQRVP